jgi:hypothetical protein
MRLEALTPREASIFACLTDVVVAPEPVLPPVRETTAVEYFDRWMARSPKLNRTAVRALLYAIELAPRLAGLGGRLRQLDRAERERWRGRVARSSLPQVRQLAKLVQGFAAVSYYGDDRIMLRVGYDPDERLRRGRELRTKEGRP